MNKQKFKGGDPLPLSLNQDALQEWMQYRIQKKKPLSDLAITKVINRLKDHPFDHQQTMVDRAISNDWQGIHDVEPAKPANIKSIRDMSIEEMLNDVSWAK
jgi:hypothetical protein